MLRAFRATFQCSHPESLVGFLIWKRSQTAFRTVSSHISQKKYKIGASRSHLKRGLVDHTLVTICQSGSSAHYARTILTVLTTRQPPHQPYLHPRTNQPPASSAFFLFAGIGHGVIGHDSCATSMFLAFLELPNQAPNSACISTVGEPYFE